MSKMNGDINVLVAGSNSGAGGIQRYIDQQMQHLSSKLNIRIYDTELPSGTGYLWFLQAVLATFLGAVRFPLRRRPDVVHVHTAHWYSFYRASFYVLFSRHIWRVPVVLHVHGSSFDGFLESESWFANRIQNVTFSACDNVIALSEYWREKIQKHTPAANVTVIPNAVDPSLYDCSPGSTTPTIVFVSHLIERKGIEEFTEALEQLVSQGDLSFEAHIAGSGPMQEMVQELVDNHQEISYHGYVPEGEKRNLLTDGSIYVLPSFAEGLPIAILEAMAAGNAIVATPVGSIPEVIGEQNGSLVEEGDSSGLASSLEQLLESPDDVREMGQVNREAVEERYDWEAVSDSLLQLYGQVLT